MKHKLHLANILKPSLGIPLDEDVVFEVDQLKDWMITAIQKGVFVEE